MPKIGFIGAGNMASAIIGGIVAHRDFSGSDVFAYDIELSKVQTLVDNMGIQRCDDIESLVKHTDYIVLAVKPHQILNVITAVSKHLNHQCLISIAAGITLKTLQESAHPDAAIIRVMPNLPSKVGEGMTSICSHLSLDHEHLVNTKKIFDCLGKTIILPEQQMNAAMAIAGSTPAMVAVMIEAMADAGVFSGLTRENAYMLAVQAVKGSSALLAEQSLHPAILKDKVASPAGTTIEMLASLEKTGFRYSIISAVNASVNKGEQMSNLNGHKNG